MAAPESKKPSRPWRTIALVGGSIVGALVVVLLIGVGVSAVVGERPAASLRRVGVAKVNGGLVVYGCEDAGIGTVELQQGGSPDGPLVWRATKTTGAPALKALPIRAEIAGYAITQPSRVPMESELALRRMDDGREVNLLRSYLVFRPEAMSDGTVVLQTGKAEALSTWLAASSC